MIKFDSLIHYLFVEKIYIYLKNSLNTISNRYLDKLIFFFNFKVVIYDQLCKGYITIVICYIIILEM